MKDSCIEGDPFSVDCQGINNPPYQDVFENIIIEIRDAQEPSNGIVAYDGQKLDATDFKPAVLPPDTVEVSLDLGGNEYDEEGNYLGEDDEDSVTWNIDFNPEGVNVGDKCYIFLTIPADIDIKKLEVNGMFVDPAGIDIFDPEELTVNQFGGNQFNGEENTQIIRFEGCSNMDPNNPQGSIKMTTGIPD
jgi:hypothetical protein